MNGEILQLKLCRFAHLVSLRTAVCKEVYEPLVSNITDGFRIVDDNLNLLDMHYECENYNSVLEPGNKTKLDSIISKELAVPKPDGGVRPITDCSMPRDISVSNYCENILEEFRYKSVDNVMAMLQEGNYMAVVDFKSAYRAVPKFPDHRKYLGLK